MFKKVAKFAHHNLKEKECPYYRRKEVAALQRLRSNFTQAAKLLDSKYINTNDETW